MHTDTDAKPTRPTPPNFGVYRRSDDRAVAGLARGIADFLAVDVAYVRAAFLAMAAVSGLGALLYAVGWFMTIDHVTNRPPRSRPSFATAQNEATRNLGFLLAAIGMMVMLSRTSLWMGASGWAVVLVSFGVATVWARSDDAQRERWTNIALNSEEGQRNRRELVLRVVAGWAIIIVGLTTFFVSLPALRSVGFVVLAGVVTTLGSFVVAGPWVWRLWQQLSEERTERIRSEEREDMAAHLHDSVLQTLALIQGSKDPHEQAILARIQERELRSWLYGATTETEGTLESAIESIAGDVERDHHVAVEAVTVGDCPLNPQLDALVRAAREALVNAAKHSGRRQVSLFVEVSDAEIEAFITDHGVGFDQASIDRDRRGITDSILGRMERHGGTAEIQSEPGEGTEVHLTMPRRQR